MVIWDQLLETLLYPQVFVYHCVASFKSKGNQAVLISCMSVLPF